MREIGDDIIPRDQLHSGIIKEEYDSIVQELTERPYHEVENDNDQNSKIRKLDLPS